MPLPTYGSGNQLTQFVAAVEKLQNEFDWGQGCCYARRKFLPFLLVEKFGRSLFATTHENAQVSYYMLSSLKGQCALRNGREKPLLLCLFNGGQH